MVGHILVVDDDLPLQRFIREVLESEGYRTEAASDGLEALERIAAHRPLLVVLDLRMPRLNGSGLVTRLQEQHDDLPILVISAYREVHDLARQMNIAESLLKPFELDDLLQAVARLMHREGDNTNP
ncbi:MAG: response regulator [Ardenticatenales bacterium]|nr:response regulator [Ardenticatenales bacterium]